MNRHLGIEIGPRTIRAVRLAGLGRRRPEIMEIEWDGEDLAEAVAELRGRFGSARAVAVALDLEVLFVKRLTLPPVSEAERRRIVRLEPERFFPVRGEDLAVAFAADGSLAFAARERQLEAWLAALGPLGPIELVEPSPVALARALRRAGFTTASVAMGDPRSQCTTAVELADGALRGARKLFGGPADRHDPDTELPGAGVFLVRAAEPDRETPFTPGAHRLDEPLASIGPVPAPYAPAWGAAMGIESDTDRGLAPDGIAFAIAARRRRQFGLAVLALAAALALAVFSIDRFRARTVDRLDAEIATLTDRATPILMLQTEAAALTRESQALSDVEQLRVDPLAVLTELSRLLPSDAHLRTVRGSQRDWQLDGYARDAARLIPLFETSEMFENARFRTATNRVLLGADEYEDFSLAVRYVRAP